MRALIKLRTLNPTTITYLLSQTHLLHFSRSSNSSKPSLSNNSETNDLHHSDTEPYRALFHEITDILGADPVSSDQSPSGFLFLRENDESKVGFEDQPDCTEGVCVNAPQSVLPEKGDSLEVLAHTQLVDMSEDDLSRVVGEITELFRGGKDSSLVEERLENLNCRARAEVFDKVLKRCFRMPQLALGIFDWLKMRGGFSHTTKTYNTILCIAGEAKEFGHVKKLVEEMDEHGIEKDVSTWTILVSHYGKAKRIGEALLAFESMKRCGWEPDAAAYSAMIRSLCCCGKGDVAMEFYKDMVQRDMVLDVRLYTMLMNCIARTGDVAAVSLLGNDMTRLSLMPENFVHGCMLKSFCVSGRIKEALEVIRDLKNKGFVSESEHFEILVRGLCKAGRVTDALEIVEIMKKRGKTFPWQ